MLFLKYVGRRKIAKDSAGPAGNPGVKSTPREDKALAEECK